MRMRFYNYQGDGTFGVSDIKFIRKVQEEAEGEEQEDEKDDEEVAAGSAIG